jgi:large subunit ribosomal protein L25
MFNLNGKIRNDFGRKLKSIRKQGVIPAVVYGPGEKNISIEVDEKDFKKIFVKAGESSLINLLVEKSDSEGGRSIKKSVLIHEIQKDPISEKIIHVDFFQPSLKDEVEVSIPLVFEGTAPAEKDLGGTLIKNILEVEIKALPQDLPHEIKVSISSLNTFQDHILIKDLVLPLGVKILKKPEEIVVSVLPPRKVEEELAVPIEEKVEDVEKVVKEKKQEDIVEEPKE